MIVSTGADYGGRLKEENAGVKKKEEAVFGLASSSLSSLAASSSSSPDSPSTGAVECSVRLIAQESLVEEEAVKQMKSTAQLPRMRLVVGLPDVHPGKGFPIGSASVSEDVFYPHLVGGDIGCGMSLFQTSVKAKKLKLDSWADALHGLEQPWDGNTAQWLAQRGIAEPTEHDDQTLGTIGGGNHFAELQTVETILDPETWKSLGLDEEQLFLLVHSGSRAYGESILRQHLDTFGPKGLLVDSTEGRNYMQNHDKALLWARANRALIAHRFMACLTQSRVSTECTDAETDPTHDGTKRMLDVWHNFVSKKHFVSPPNAPDSASTSQTTTSTQATSSESRAEMDPTDATPSELASPPMSPSPALKSSINEESTAVGQSLWLHRKGAAPADQGPVIIPGSRGHFSYLVLPSKDNSDLEHAAYSLAHGAGRKWNRGKALQLGKANSKKSADSLTTTDLGSRVICENKDLLYEEVPAAYKEIEAIIEDLKSFKLITVIAVFKPLITYKTRVINYGNKGPSPFSGMRHRCGTGEE